MQDNRPPTSRPSASLSPSQQSPEASLKLPNVPVLRRDSEGNLVRSETGQSYFLDACNYRSARWGVYCDVRKDGRLDPIVPGIGLTWVPYDTQDYPYSRDYNPDKLTDKLVSGEVTLAVKVGAKDVQRSVEIAWEDHKARWKTQEDLKSRQSGAASARDGKQSSPTASSQQSSASSGAVRPGPASRPHGWVSPKKKDDNRSR